MNFNDKVRAVALRLIGNNNAIINAASEATEPKVYVALLTQSGTDAPVATVLKNTLGGEVVWTYMGVGYYRVDEENCALLNISLSNSAISFGAIGSTRLLYGDLYDGGDGPLIDIILKNLSGIATNVMNNQLVKIEVYP